MFLTLRYSRTKVSIFPMSATSIINLKFENTLMNDKPPQADISRQAILNTEPVELYKILKFEGLVPSGGVAKMAIDAGDVLVNGEVETRKRKKMLAGDVIEFNGETILLVLDE